MRFIKLNMVTGSHTDDLEQTTEATAVCYVNPDEIREFYPRRGNRTGTRLSYKNSAGIAVTESIDEVLSAILGTQN